MVVSHGATRRQGTLRFLRERPLLIGSPACDDRALCAAAMGGTIAILLSLAHSDAVLHDSECSCLANPHLPERRALPT